MLNATDKLYYKDAYVREFRAEVLSVTPCEGGYDVVLDRTAFFPEEGGQSADRGYIEDARVLGVSECSGIVHHLTDRVPSGDFVACKIDFDERFEKMQLHTAEHILCGIIHREFGLDNVGFHLGADEVTFDISAPLSREQLDTVEDAACEAVFANIEIETFFPTPEELAALEYRSKLELSENVRIVKIGEVDSCACCAPHVKRTGEIGAIKLLHAEKHRGGMRIWMTAGRRAVADYREKYTSEARISAMLSVPISNTAEALTRYMKDTEQLKFLLKEAKSAYAVALAEAVPQTDGNLVYLMPDAGAEEMRSFANTALGKVGGILVVLSGTSGDYKYVIASNSVNVSERIREINSALFGRGGGRGNMVQGSFYTTFELIKAFFEK